MFFTSLSRQSADVCLENLKIWNNLVQFEVLCANRQHLGEEQEIRDGNRFVQTCFVPAGSRIKEMIVKARVKPLKKDQFLLFSFKLYTKECIFQFVWGIWTTGLFALDEANTPRNA